MNVVGLNAQHESNLRKLAGYLLSGNLRADFNMGVFSSSDDSHRSTCGTVGCAAGHGPYAGIEKRDDECWSEYIFRQFGIDEESELLSRVWGWCFASRWQQSDNTPEGAARRVLWVLEHGVPDLWSYQMVGSVPLCYQDFEITPDMLDWQAVLNASDDDSSIVHAEFEVVAGPVSDADFYPEQPAGDDDDTLVENVGETLVERELLTKERFQGRIDLAAEQRRGSTHLVDAACGRYAELARDLWADAEYLRRRLARTEQNLKDAKSSLAGRDHTVRSLKESLGEAETRIAELERELKGSAERWGRGFGC